MQSAPQPRPTLPEVIPATFTGKVGTYTRIYYTNVFLSVITFGIYASWAKVRNRRFFYGNTSFLGSVFDFDAKPLAILISRIIVIAIFFALTQVERVWNLTLGEFGFAFFVFLLLLPILLVRGRSFNFRHSLWRGVRFSYAKRFGPAYAHLFLFTIPQVGLYALLVNFYLDNPNLTLLEQDNITESWPFKLFIVLLAHFVLLWPIGYWWRHRIRVVQMNFGKLDFKYTPSIKAYYRIYAAHLLVLILLAVPLSYVFLANSLDTEKPEYAFYAGSLAWLGVYALIVSYVAHTARVFWNGIATVEGSKMAASFSPLAYAFWITIPNHMINVASLSLLVPYTRVRRWRYLAAHIAFLPSASLREVASGASSLETAVASEALDIEGFDIDLGMI